MHSASPAITYSKNLLGNANSLWREWPGKAKKPTSKCAASRTSVRHRHRRRKRNAIRQPEGNDALLQSIQKFPIARTADRQCEFRAPIGNTVDRRFDAPLWRDDTVIQYLDPVGPGGAERRLFKRAACYGW